jgi:hypothetical protein
LRPIVATSPYKTPCPVRSRSAWIASWFCNAPGLRGQWLTPLGAFQTRRLRQKPYIFRGRFCPYRAKAVGASLLAIWRAIE